MQRYHERLAAAAAASQGEMKKRSTDFDASEYDVAREAEATDEGQRSITTKPRPPRIAGEPAPRQAPPLHVKSRKGHNGSLRA